MFTVCSEYVYDGLHLLWSCLHLQRDLPGGRHGGASTVRGHALLPLSNQTGPRLHPTGRHSGLIYEDGDRAQNEAQS